MKSDLVVISWWSNCLGLTCLHNLVHHTENRDIYVLQAGKPAAQKERFRAHLPPAVQELPYPAHRPAEHGKVIEAVARDLLGAHEGLWFFDHDLFVFQDLEAWLGDMDRAFERSACCLCHPQPTGGPSITTPAFWLSPARFPEGLPGFEPIPFRKTRVSQRPDLFQAAAGLRMPEKDTLVRAREFLAARESVREFSLRSFPRHDHLGGLYMFAGEIPPPALYDWMAGRVERFTAFYEACPQAWMAVEDPVLLERLKTFRRAVSAGCRPGTIGGDKTKRQCKTEPPGVPGPRSDGQGWDLENDA